MENRRFRNHISIIFERLGKGFWILMTFLFWEILTDIETLWQDIKSFGEWMEGGEVTITVILLIPIFLAIVLGWQLLVWSKTYISIQENVIVIEKNTLNKKKNTIGIKNISNVNLEQNLFEMLLGTNKVKLDTNSMSTADKTDVLIVLKKRDAEEFRRQIMAIIYGDEADDLIDDVFGDYRADIEKNSWTEGKTPYAQRNAYETTDQSGYTYGKSTQRTSTESAADIGEIMLHGFFSINLLSVVIAIGTIIGMFGVITGLAEEGFTEESVLGLISTILIIAGLGFSAIWDIVQGFLRYFDFRVKRRGDKIHIQYGILKKVSYTIPIDKINAVKLIQTPQARLTNRYMAEIVNVGMNDEEDKSGRAFLLLYGKKDKAEEKLRALLPEFADHMEMEINHYQPGVWAVWSISLFFYLACMVIVLGVGNTFFPEYMKWIVLGVAILTIFVLVMRVFKYKTEGSYVGEQMLMSVEGGLGRRIIFVKYHKIQSIEAKQNFLAKHFHLQKADIYLVAGTTDRLQEIPYFVENELEKMREYILRR